MSKDNDKKTDLARQEEPPHEFLKLLQRSQKQIQLALPKHLTAERMCRMAITIFRKTPRLRECSPMSLLGAVIQASELGLELSSPLGHAYLVPYGKEAVLQIGYRGFMDLAYRSGQVAAMPMRMVHAADRFRVCYGTEDRIEHEPAMGDRGEVTGYYSVLKLRDGGRDFEYMSVAECELHRDRYAANKRSDGPWATHFDAMALKTTLRRLAKRFPVSVELVRAAMIDEYGEAGIRFDAPELPALPAPPVNGTLAQQSEPPQQDDGPAEVWPPGDAGQPSQARESTENDESAKQDLVLDLGERLKLAASQDDFNAVGKLMAQHREWLGEPRYAAVLNTYQERYRAWQEAQRKPAAGRPRASQI